MSTPKFKLDSRTLPPKACARCATVYTADKFVFMEHVHADLTSSSPSDTCKKCTRELLEQSRLQHYRSVAGESAVVEKTCSSCNLNLPLSDFYVRYKRKMPTTISDWTTKCKACTLKNSVDKFKSKNKDPDFYRINKIKRKQYYEKNKERQKLQQRIKYYGNHEKFKEHQRDVILEKCKDIAELLRFRKKKTILAESGPNRYLGRRFTDWRHSAKKRDISWELSFEQILELFKKSDGLCFYSKVPLKLNSGHRETISLDRIDSSKGYTIDNVVFCSTLVNRMKLDMTLTEFYHVMSSILANREWLRLCLGLPKFDAQT